MLRVLASAVVGFAALHIVACARSKAQEVETQPAPVLSQPVSAEVVPLSVRISRPAPERLVAIGDLHGDLEHARRALRLAGAIDARDHWAGG